MSTNNTKFTEIDAAVQKKEFNQAVSLLRSMLREDPNDAEAHIRLGNLLIYSQSQAQAKDHLARAVALEPNNVKAWSTLLLYHTSIQKENSVTIEVCQHALKNIYDEHIYKLLIGLYSEEGRIEEMKNAAQELYDKSPDDPKNMAYLAGILYDQKMYDKALALYEKMISGGDKEHMSIDDWKKWSALMNYSERLEEASVLLGKLSSSGADVDMQLLYVQSMIDAEKYEEAIRYAKALAEKEKSDIRPILKLIHIMQISGDKESLAFFMKEAFLRDPDNTDLLYGAVSEKQINYNDTEYKNLCRMMAKIESMESKEKIKLHFTAGKAYDDLGDYAASFEHYRQGGITKLQNADDRSVKMENMLKYFKEHIDSKAIENMKRDGHPSQSPVFIVGLPRSGTTLLERVISSFDGVHGAGELPYAYKALDGITLSDSKPLTLDSFSPWADDSLPTMAERGAYYLQNALKHVPSGTDMIVDKMPGNSMVSGLLHAMFPHGHIIYARRHPVEIALSAYRIHFNEGHLWSYDLNLAGKYIRLVWEFMDYWKSVLPTGAILDVFYENVVTDLEGESRQIAAYLGREWSPKCLEFHKSSQPVKTASLRQVRKPLYTTSMNRWKKYAPYLKPLLDEIPDLIERYEKELEASQNRAA